MSGIPYWTFDIGGVVIARVGGTFSKGGKDPAYQELYTRMFQFGASAIFRSHEFGPPREIWEWASRAHPHEFDRAALPAAALHLLAGLAGHGSRRDDAAACPWTSPPTGTHGVADRSCRPRPHGVTRPSTSSTGHEPSVLVPPRASAPRTASRGCSPAYYKDTAYKTLSLSRWTSVTCLVHRSARLRHGLDCQSAGGQLVPSQSGRTSSTSGVRHRRSLDGRAAHRLAGQRPYTEIVTLEASRPTLKVELERHRCAHAAPLEDTEIFAREGQNPVRGPAPSTCPQAHPDGLLDGRLARRRADDRRPCPDQTLPLLVRAGSIVPLGPELEYAPRSPPADPGCATRRRRALTLYEDERRLRVREGRPRHDRPRLGRRSPPAHPEEHRASSRAC
jgi:alpha-D-xyloside xylohydrolase